MQRRVFGVKQVGRQQENEQQRAEQTRPRLLEPEQQELVEPQPPAGPGVERLEPPADCGEAGVSDT